MTNLSRSLGVCYYPEHWPEELWADDAARMVDAGITWVRIGEFAWSRLQRSPNLYTFEWFDHAIETLANAGLKVVLGTPTATPPRWMVDRHPDMLAVDIDGRRRKFGSRRHYCFSHEGYRAECARIVEVLAERYGRNSAIHAWQTDNEYSCHDTALSYSDAALAAFQDWLRKRYTDEAGNPDISVLNAAWGNIFWSMEYDDFDQIELPNLTVTEPNPAHSLAFRRFTSDQVVSFNRLQTEIIRRHSTAPITHNFMGRITDFDHFDVGKDLDFSSWDSYPLGFLEDRCDAGPEHQRKYACQGDPDFQAFHHDLYRAVGKGRWWVMEQQPGPVNWAPYNPAPLPGMVRLWTWEAFAHGAEAVCFFRWRQAPFAQEQMHAGLLRPDSKDAPALAEAKGVAAELKSAPDVLPHQAEIGIIFDYDADAAWHVQPHGQDLSYFGIVFDAYRALRKLGLSINILPSHGANFEEYKLIMAPGLIHMPDALKTALDQSGARVIIGPRSGARNSEFSIPEGLPPGLPGLDAVVSRVESLRPDMPKLLQSGGRMERYFEHLEGGFEILEQTHDSEPALIKSGNWRYLAGLPDGVTYHRILSGQCSELGLHVLDLPEGLRCRQTGQEMFWFNYSSEAVQFDGRELPPAGVLREML